MRFYFAGFYCDPSELAENHAAQMKVDILFGFIATAYVYGIVVILINFKGYSFRQKVAVCIFLPVSLIVGCISYLAVGFFAMPHWCGN